MQAVGTVQTVSWAYHTLPPSAGGNHDRRGKAMSYDFSRDDWQMRAWKAEAALADNLGLVQENETLKAENADLKARYDQIVEHQKVEDYSEVLDSRDKWAECAREREAEVADLKRQLGAALEDAVRWSRVEAMWLSGAVVFDCDEDGYFRVRWNPAESEDRVYRGGDPIATIDAAREEGKT